MSKYSVKTEVFEGPFDLLLDLVSRQKLDINAISLSDIADEYIEHIERMKELDLDVASEFLLLASTLIEIKAHSLMPKEEVYVGDELDDLSPLEMRSILVSRLIAYKQFKNVASELAYRMEAEGRMHPRNAGLEKDFLNLMPDYLEGVTLHNLATICADLVFKREVFLLEAEHIAAIPLSLESKAESIRKKLHTQNRIAFSDIVEVGAPPEVIVVAFLALLELYKRGICTLYQDSLFGEIYADKLDDDQSKMLGIEEGYDEYE